jgi:transposase
MTEITMPTLGLDLGDRFSHFCEFLPDSSKPTDRGRVRTTPEAILKFFEKRPLSLVVMEVGAHSPWLSRLVGSLGHEVVVANPRKLELIYRDAHKCDDLDCEYLARLARVDPELLSPIKHRQEETQKRLAVLKARDALVRSRANLAITARSLAKSLGVRLPKCSTKSFANQVRRDLPEELEPALGGLVDTVGELSRQINEYDREIKRLCRDVYPETALLMQVTGVGELTALAFVLTLEDPLRFLKSRSVGAYLGLSTRRDQSGKVDKELGITKEGDPFLRRLLVQSAHYILGRFGPDSDLRRWGLGLAARGGRAAKKRAVIAVARKLAVLLHVLWKTGEEYEPLRCSKPEMAA